AARGGIMLACYGLGILAAVGTAWVFKRTMLKGAPAAFILELPTYKVPQASQVARQVWVNTSEFVKKAGTVIFCLSVILWAMTYYPRLPQANVTLVENLVKSSQTRYAVLKPEPNEVINVPSAPLPEADLKAQI